MTKTTLTIGLFDKDSEKQIIATDKAKTIISEILLNLYKIFAFTMIECNGYYKMSSTGNIVNEPSIRVEIATDDDLRDDYNTDMQNAAGDHYNKLAAMVFDLKYALNQESIMVEVTKSDISFM